MRKTSGMILSLLLASTLTLVFIQPAKASGGTIYIRADGSVDPPTAPILNVGNVYYTFTADIYSSIVVERDDIVIDGAHYTLQRTGGTGFELYDIENVTIERTNVKGFTYGIYLDHSSDNCISGNTMANNGYGIRLENSSNKNIISNNNVTSNSQIGVYLCTGSSNNTITSNTFLNDGFGVWDSYQNTVKDNTVNGKPLVYFENKSDLTIREAGQVIVVNSNNITIEKLDLSDTSFGIELWATNNSKIMNNNCSNDLYGIYLYFSSNNNIVDNTASNNKRGYGITLDFKSSSNDIINSNLSNNGVGIRVDYFSNNSTLKNNTISDNSWYGILLADYSSGNIIANNLISNNWAGIRFERGQTSSNSIYHNNFMNNTAQIYAVTAPQASIWDDGYPSGGNYWSDYTDVDLFSGPYQNETGSDGIWDHPYVIDANNKDHYPFVNPWTPTSPWPMFQHDPQHTGRSPYVGPSGSPEAMIWLGNQTVNEVFGSPIIGSDGVLYFGKLSLGGKWGLCAYYPNGVQRWFYEIQPAGGGASLLLPSALSKSERTVYTHDDAEIFAVDTESGNLRWKRTFVYIQSNLVVAENGILYFTALCHLPDDSYRNYLIGLNENGEEILSYDVGDNSLTPSSPTIDIEGTIYVGYNNTLFAVNPNGTERWRRTFEAVLKYHPPSPPTVTTPSIAGDGTLYVVVRCESDGQSWADTWYYNHLHAIDPENPNEDKWTRKLRSNWPQNPVIDSNGNVYVTNWVYVVGSDGQSSLVTYSPQGDQIWAQDFTAYGFPGLLLVDAQRTVYVLRMSVYGSATLHVFSAEGNQPVVSLPFQEGHRQPFLSLSSDGTLYIGGHKNLYAVKSSLPMPPNQPPTCVIKLQRDGVEISEVDVGQFFDIYVGGSSDDTGIKQVRFSSDDAQDGIPTGKWTQWYDWGTSSEDWNASTKIKRWSFTTPGYKEVWAEVKDDINQTAKRLARIYVPGSQPPSCVVELQKDGIKIDHIDAGQAFDIYVGDSTDDAAIVQVMFSADDSQDGVPTGEWTDWYDWNQHSGDWSALDKTMKWSFAKGGKKEVWAMIKDSDGNVVWNYSNIFVHPGYAIIVAGSGIWKMTLDHCANNAYRVLRNLGFDDDHIFYLNSQDQDVDGDGNSEVDGAASLSWFTYVMDEAKYKIDGNPTPLILYFVGHGVPDAFLLDGSQDLNVLTLRDKLGEFSSETPMVIVINSCYSGSFITPRYPEQSISAQNRIIITSAQNDQERKVFTWVRFSDRFWGNLGKAFNVKDAFTSRATWGDNSHSWLDDNGDRVGHPPDNLGDDGNLASTTYIGVPGTEDLELEPWQFGWKRSPGELRVYDSQNRVTGLVDGEVKVEIPNSIYFEQDEFIMIFPPFDTYRYDVVGGEIGTYGLDIGSIDGGEAVTFTAIDIPTSITAIHQFTINWTALSHGEKGVTVQVDSEGDGVFEYTFTSDSELTQSEFLAQTTPPLSVSISPLSSSILVGQSVTFTSTVSGGYTPYTYQWYLNGIPVSGATSNTWIFTPTTSGIYYIHLEVTDNKGNTAQSETARIVVSTVPVGGYSIPIQLPTTAKPVTPYIALLTILTATFITIKRKTKRKH